MYEKLVKDIMIPVADYPTILQDESILEAIKLLREAEKNVPRPMQRYRAVLVKDNDNKIIGKVGYLSFLRALEPKYNQIFDMEKLTRISLSSEYLGTIMEQFRLWDSSFDIYKIASTVKVNEVMQPAEENINENEPLSKAIHKIIMWQSLSILVTRGIEIVGIIRLSDIYNDIEEYLINECNK